MRRGYEDFSSIGGDTVHLGHCAHHVGQVFDDMGHVDARELSGFERPRKLIEIPDNIRERVDRPVDSNGAWLDLAFAATDFEGAHFRLSPPSTATSCPVMKRVLFMKNSTA